MAFRRRQRIESGITTRHARLLAASFACALFAVPGQAQQAPQGPELQSAPPAAEQQAPANRPGFLDAVGRWFGGSTEAIGNLGKEAAGVAKDAAGSVAAIPGTRIVTGRHVCPTSSNGAPDCQQGADGLCRSKGFQGGRHLDIMSGQRCSARAWLEAGAKRGKLCRTETYVTRAVCQ
jgi:hypothetical protein